MEAIALANYIYIMSICVFAGSGQFKVPNQRVIKRALATAKCSMQSKLTACMCLSYYAGKVSI